MYIQRESFSYAVHHVTWCAVGFFFIIPNPNPRTSQTCSRTVRHKDEFVYTWRDCCFGYLASKPAGMFAKLSYDNGAS